MARTHYINISIPKGLIDEVDKVVTKGTKGFNSRADFVKTAIRNELDNLK